MAVRKSTLQCSTLLLLFCPAEEYISLTAIYTNLIIINDNKAGLSTLLPTVPFSGLESRGLVRLQVFRLNNILKTLFALCRFPQLLQTHSTFISRE